jgi:hypothetical protein
VEFLEPHPAKVASLKLRLSTSAGYPRLTTGIPMGKPMGMETRGSRLLMITGLHGSGCLFWVLRVLATSTCETNIFLFFTNLIYYSSYHTPQCPSARLNAKHPCANSPTASEPLLPSCSFFSFFSQCLFIKIQHIQILM